ncbi:hypothetical protein ACQKLN_16060 [Paenibacillus glucanolyticus]
MVAVRTLHSLCCLKANVDGSRMNETVRLNRCLKKSWNKLGTAIRLPI